MQSFDSEIDVDVVLSGKLRRYHNLSLLRQITYPPIVLRNIRDGFLVVAGFVQSLFKLIFWRPDVVFTKGGYVCLPIGLAAWLLKIPLVIHDSDAHPGLTNRILSRFATTIATGAPLKFYPYPKSKSHYVGIPIAEKFRPFSDQQKRSGKSQLGLSPDKPLIVVTGGGLGAKRINDAVMLNLLKLIESASVILISGTGQYDELRSLAPKDRSDFQLHDFVSDDMALMLGSADIVVARAGATTILELAALNKPTILIPNGLLTGGHQLKNAAVYTEVGAVVTIDENELEKNPEILTESVTELLGDEKLMRQMAQSFAQFAKPQAASEMADLVVSAVASR